MESWQDKDLWQSGGDFENLLVNYLPSQPKQNIEEGPINWISVMSLGLLWCEGEPEERADVMFKTCNPQGENQASIAYTDDEMKIVIDTIIQFATTRALMFHFRDKMSLSAKKAINSYQRRRACFAQRASEVDDEDKQGFIMLMFGTEGKLPTDEFKLRL